MCWDFDTDDGHFVPASPPHCLWVSLWADGTGGAAGLLSRSREGVRPLFFPEWVAVVAIIAARPSASPGRSMTLGVVVKGILGALPGV